MCRMCGTTMTKYLYIGLKGVNIMECTTGIKVVMCEDCGQIIELKTDDHGFCECKEYWLWDNVWNRVNKSN